jgi:hypothetical protein
MPARWSMVKSVRRAGANSGSKRLADPAGFRNLMCCPLRGKRRQDAPQQKGCHSFTSSASNNCTGMSVKCQKRTSFR